MPDPGITDPDFNNPASARPRPRRWKPRPRVRLPREYADFQLEDGRALGEVMGPDFFGPSGAPDGGRPLPGGVRDPLVENRPPPAGILGDDPRIASRPARRSTEDGDHGKTGEQPILPGPDYSADYMDPAPRPLRRE